jgi:hypothetical protein
MGPHIPKQLIVMGLQFTILYILLMSLIEPAGLLQDWLQGADVG